jgi:hypothetical protein
VVSGTERAPELAHVPNAIVSGEKDEPYRRKGLCPKCGDTKTHQKKKSSIQSLRQPLNGAMEPLTVEDKVYDGVCLHCFPRKTQEAQDRDENSSDKGRGHSLISPGGKSAKITNSYQRIQSPRRPKVFSAGDKPSPPPPRVPKPRPVSFHSQATSAMVDTMSRTAASSLGSVTSGRPPLPMGGGTTRQLHELTPVATNVLDYSSGEEEDDGSSLGSTLSRRIRMAQSEDDSIELALPQSLDSILQDMLQHPDDAMVQEFGCSALGSLKQEPLSTLNTAIRAIKEALQRHAGNLKVQIEGLRAFRRLSSSLDACCDGRFSGTCASPSTVKAAGQDIRVNKDLCMSIEEHGGLPPVMETMKNFPTSRTIQRESIRVLRNALRASVTVSEVILKCCGVESIIKAMRNHRESNSVQEDGCIIIWIVSFNQMEAQDIVLEKNGVGAILQAMMSHPEIEKIHYHACGALHTLTFNDELKAHVIEMNAFNCLIKAIKEHGYSELVTEKACSALLNLLINKKGEKKLCVMNTDEMKTIVRSMELHSESRLVQRSAIRLLEASVRSRNNLSNLRCCSNVRTVLLLSSDRYPEECLRSATRILSMLDNRNGV